MSVNPAWPAVVTFINARTEVRGGPTWHGRIADPRTLTPGGAYSTVWVCEHLHRSITAADRCAGREGFRRYGMRLPAV